MNPRIAFVGQPNPGKRSPTLRELAQAELASDGGRHGRDHEFTELAKNSGLLAQVAEGSKTEVWPNIQGKILDRIRFMTSNVRHMLPYSPSRSRLDQRKTLGLSSRDSPKGHVSRGRWTRWKRR